MRHRDIPPRRYASLAFFCIATILMVPLERYPIGGVAWIASLYYALLDPETSFRRRMTVLLGCVAILSFAPINTDTSNHHVLRLGGSFLAVVLLPALILGRTDPGVIRYRFWPTRLRKLDLFYTAISIPLAWAILGWYFGYNDFMYRQWTLPATPDDGETMRLFWGINAVGILSLIHI